jgi:transcription initiation factor TFIID TATA-box-binding protein
VNKGMIEVNIQNIVASAILAQKLDLDNIAQSISFTEYEPGQFPGLIYRIQNPKTATLLFRSGKVICTGAKNVENVKKTLSIIADKLRKIGTKIYNNDILEITIQNIVATANLNGEMNLNQVAIGLGLDKIEYEPEQFPGLVYRLKTPKIVMLLFSSGKIVCTGGRSLEDISVSVENLAKELHSLDLFL